MRKAVYHGINAEGNHYTVYDDGSFRYKNTNEAGKTASSYYYAGKGHGFFRKNSDNGQPGYAWHENQNQGTRTMIEKKPKAKDFQK